MKLRLALLAALAACFTGCHSPRGSTREALAPSAAAATDFAHQREQVAALGNLTSPPSIHPATGFAPVGSIQPLFFEGLAYQGKPTRVFAWLGLPENRTGKVPGVVLVHGGGGTAFKEWVKKWNEQGFAAISIAVEGQTDERIPNAPPGAQWKRHAAAGPARNGIYGDSAAPLTDQWMYHAVAATVLANSLLRSLPEVDAAHVGVCGISWGGIITSTVVGIDPRFAFGIPIYGSGALDRAPNQYGRALKDLAVYREVWEPLLRLPRATMPLLWLTGPRDAHFPLDVQQASYRAAAGPRLVSVPFDMKHGHPPGWNPPDSYAFAKSVVETGRPWAREVLQEFRDGTARVAFENTRAVRNGTLVSKRAAEWAQSPAKLETVAGRTTASASIPAGTTAYYFNLDAAGLTLSSELQTINPAAPPRVTPALPGSNWDRVPLNLHFGKRTGDLTDAEIDFVARHSTLIALEKSHGVTPTAAPRPASRTPRGGSHSATRTPKFFSTSTPSSTGPATTPSKPTAPSGRSAPPQARSSRTPPAPRAPIPPTRTSASGGRKWWPRPTAPPRWAASLSMRCRKRFPPASRNRSATPKPAPSWPGYARCWPSPNANSAPTASCS
jgi:dienelactone hydrolase